MILLDNNILSEPMKPVSDERAVRWLDAQAISTLFLPAIVVGELGAGIAMLPKGKRQATMAVHLEGLPLPQFADRVLPFDLECRRAYASILAVARKRGRPLLHRNP